MPKSRRAFRREPANRRNRAPLRCLSHGAPLTSAACPTAAKPSPKSSRLIEPFNKKGVEVTEATRFAQDLEWDSLTVLDFVANIEDEFDVIITMNMQAEIETVGQLVDALEQADSGRDRPLLQVRSADRAARHAARRPASPTRSTWSWSRSKARPSPSATASARSCSAPTITWA